MKKLSALIIYLILICVFVLPVSTKPVKSNDAVLVGKARLKAQKRFWKNKPDMAPRTASGGEEYSVLKHRELKHKGRVIAHVLDLSPEGCIILSSDTDIHPVIAYSLKGKFLMEDTPDNAFLHLLELDMGNRLDALPATSEKLKKKNSALWGDYVVQDESFVQELSSEDVWGPWLETTWHQGYPYKTFCPIDPTTGNRSVVGCAATAMAQIVNFWKYPTGLTFNWDEDHYISNKGKDKEIKIDDDHETLDFPSFDELNQKLVDIKYDGNVDEIAAICFACGISASMNYSSQGSGTYASYVFSGYWRFGYSYVDKWMFEEDFYDVLKEDMKEARPAQLHIYSSTSGHAIVADGYRTNWTGESGDFYHLNFGWGGSYPDLIDECWYTLPEGLPSGYNEVGSAAMNIYPLECPIAYSQSVTTDEDTPVNINLIAIGDSLTYTIVTQPTKGTLSGTAPYLVYTPAPNLNGNDSFTFKASDGASDSNVATVSITVEPVNDLPVITSTPVVTATEGVLYTYDVEATDLDTGDVLTYSLTASPTGMSIDAATGLIQWIPADDQTGDNDVSVQVEDTSEATDTQAFTVAVLNVNDPPVAHSQSVTTDEDASVGMILTASDPDGDPLTYTVVTQPTRGTLSGTAPNLVYTPAPNLNGNDSFTFKASDGASDSNVATVSITVEPVNDLPVITSTPVVTATEGVLYTYDVEATDADTGDVLTYSLTASPTGMSIDAATGLIQWIPAGDQTGDNDVSVQVEDASEAIDTQAFTVAVMSVNDPPVAYSQSVTTDEDAPVGMILTASDPDGDPLTYTVVTQPTRGTLSGTAPYLVYTPAPSLNGTDSFTFKASDGASDSNVATVSITVEPVNDLPVITSTPVVTATEGVLYTYDVEATDADTGDVLTYSLTASPTGMSIDAATGLIQWTPAGDQTGDNDVSVQVEDASNATDTQAFTVAVLNVNDPPVVYSQSVVADEDIPIGINLTGSDPDGDPLIYTVVTQPTRGTLTGTTPYLVYTPAPNLNGTDRFTFKASDGASDSNVATVSITVHPVNDPPVLTSTPVVTATEGVLYTYDVEATDADTGDVLTYSLTASPGMIIDAATGLIQWIPAGDQTGDNDVSVQVEDASEAIDTQAFTVAVMSVNDPPVAYSQSVVADEDIPIGINLTGSDPDGDPLIYTVVTQPTKGILSGTAPYLVYTPAPNLNGTDSFTFKASDGASDSNVATVSITVEPVNDLPVITSTPVVTATEGVLYTYDVEATDVDTGDVLTYSLTASPTGMSIDAATGLIQWIPADDQTGDNDVSVQVEDASEATDTQAFTVAVMNVNDPPVAYSQSVVADEDTPVGITLTASDPDGDSLIYTVVTEPASGTLTGTAPYLVYTPAPNLNGTDNFTFKVSDGTTDSDLAIVIITVRAGSLVIQAFNSVDLLVTDPKWRKVGKGISTISSAKYTEADMDGDGIPDDQVIIPKPMTGNYSIQVVSEPGAMPTDTYTLDVTYGHKSSKLADKVKIKDIPGNPYIFLLTQSFSYKMKPGWNLISLPLKPLDTDPGVVLSSIDGKYNSVRAYNPDTGWSVYAPGTPGDLHKMEPGAGYWIEMDKTETLTVEGTELDSTAIFLKGGGWNLVGYNSLDPKNAEDCMRCVEGDINSVWSFSLDTSWSVYAPYGASDLSIMKPGCGYWMEVDRDCIWDVNADTPAAPPLTIRSRMSDVSSDRPEIPYSIWGNVEIDDESILRRDASVILKVDGKVESSCKLRTEGQRKYSYILHVPAIADSSAQVYIQIGDKLVHAAPVPTGEPGQLIRLDLSVRDTPGANFLYQNYPNPFNPDTWIPYQLKEDANVVIRIYALSGQLVRILNLGRKKAGSYTLRSKAAHWDGKNEVGEHVASGVYFYNVQAGNFVATKKLVMIE